MLYWMLDVAMFFVAIGLVYLAGYYTVYGLVKNNVFGTEVEQGWCKIILRRGKFYKIVGPGWHWVGLPGIFTLYRKTMRFMKSVTDEKGKPQAEPHPTPEEKEQGKEDTSSFKTTEYPYACPFVDEEDSHGLPLSGILAVDAILENYEKAFFKVSDWYAKMNTSILSKNRGLIAQISYDDDIVGRDTPEEQAKESFSKRLWEALNQRKDGKPSVIEDLRNNAGIRVLSVELRSIDPPPDWRATTLEPYKAQRQRDAAKYQAETSAVLFDDTNQALKAWMEGQRAAGHEPTSAEIKAKQTELHERALAKMPGWQQVHVKGLENATTAVVGGGGNAGVFVGGNKGGKGQGGRKRGEKKAVEDMTEEEKRRAWDRMGKGLPPEDDEDDDEEEEEKK